MIDVEQKKDKIISFLESEGPSLPVRIAKAIQMDPMFASAIASELITSGKIKPSNIKIGASFLYLIPGQENQLEKFSDNLKSGEKRAFEKLKENKILIDEEEEPAIRVALRNIKDFATPFKFKEKIMWKYSFIPNEEIEKLLVAPKETIKENQEKDPLEEETSIEEVQEKIIKEKLEEEKQEEIQEEIIKTHEAQESESIFQKSKEKIEIEVPKAWETKKKEIEEARKKSIEKKVEDIFITNDEVPEDEPEFLSEIKTFLQEKNIEFLKEIKTERKEVMASIKINSDVGEIIFTMTAKNKKTINKDDINFAFRMAKNSNTPCLLIIRKEPSKSIQKILDENNLVKLMVMN